MPDAGRERGARWPTSWRIFAGLDRLLRLLSNAVDSAILEEWTRHRLRSVIWKQWKRGARRFAELVLRGVDRQTGR